MKEDETSLPVDHPATGMGFLYLQQKRGITAHGLRLNEGCICTIMRNLHINEGLLKTHHVLVEQFHETVMTIDLIDTSLANQDEVHIDAECSHPIFDSNQCDVVSVCMESG